MYASRGALLDYDQVYLAEGDWPRKSISRRVHRLGPLPAAARLFPGSTEPRKHGPLFSIPIRIGDARGRIARACHKTAGDGHRGAERCLLEPPPANPLQSSELAFAIRGLNPGIFSFPPVLSILAVLFSVPRRRWIPSLSIWQQMHPFSEHRTRTGRIGQADSRRRGFGVPRCLLQRLRPYKAAIAIALILLVISAGSELALGKALSRVIDRGFSSTQGNSIDSHFLVLYGNPCV